MTAKLVDPSSYPAILSKLKNLPEFTFLNPIIKFEVDKLNTGTRLELFEYTEVINGKEESYYLALKYHQFSNLIVIGNCSYLNGKFERTAIIQLFPIVKEKFLAESLFETVLPEGSEHELNRLMEKEGTHPYKPLYQNTFVYYIEEKNHKDFLEQQISLPNCFEARTILPEFSKQMMSVLLHYQDGDELQAAIRLEELPSAGIFEISTNKLVAFEYNDGIGNIAHQYVYPEYRCKGLGKAVEILVCQKNLRELGILPSKCVATARPKVLAITEKAKYWSKLLDANGNPSEIWWTIYSKTPQEKIVIRDN
uniref:Glycine N-acyltransferase-like protein n=1 Tax=Panagrolaimus sp. ES5 TaxID=591445 RepID=A0AC34FIN7_9BILA